MKGRHSAVKRHIRSHPSLGAKWPGRLYQVFSFPGSRFLVCRVKGSDNRKSNLPFIQRLQVFQYVRERKKTRYMGVCVIIKIFMIVYMRSGSKWILRHCEGVTQIPWRLTLEPVRDLSQQPGSADPSIQRTPALYSPSPGMQNCNNPIIHYREAQSPFQWHREKTCHQHKSLWLYLASPHDTVHILDPGS